MAWQRMFVYALLNGMCCVAEIIIMMREKLLFCILSLAMCHLCTLRNVLRLKPETERQAKSEPLSSLYSSPFCVSVMMCWETYCDAMPLINPLNSSKLVFRVAETLCSFSSSRILTLSSIIISAP